MKTLFYSLILAVIFFEGLATAATAQQPAGALQLKVMKTETVGRLIVELTNTTPKPLRIWQAANSWGAAHWRVLVIRNGRLQGYFQNPNRAYTRNGPGFMEIPAGSKIDQNIDINDGQWCEVGECSKSDQRGVHVANVSFERGDILVVSYDVPMTGEARERAVWYGVAATLATVQ